VDANSAGLIDDNRMMTDLLDESIETGMSASSRRAMIGEEAMKRNGLIITLMVGMLIILASPVPSAYGQVANATLVGTVVDPTGAVIPEATVTVRNVATNETRTTMTTSDGLYRIPNLLPGTYTVRVEKSGFKTSVTSDVILHVGETTRVDVTLQIGALEEEVEIVGGAPLMNTEEGRITHIVESRQVEELPLIKRNIYQLPVLEPGTTPTRIQIPTYYSNSVYQLGFIAYGKRIRGTNFLLDGAPNTDNGLGGIPAISPILDAVQEFQVSTNNFDREYGRNYGAIINVATKSGTNEVHGSAWEFHRNAALNARNFFDLEKPVPNIQNQFGVSIGGPIRKDATFWFFAYEGFRERRGITRKVQIETPALRQWVAANRPGSVADYLFRNFPGPDPIPGTEVDLGTPQPGEFVFDPCDPDTGSGCDGIPDIGVGIGQAVNATTNDQYLIRLDHSFNQGKDKLFGRWVGFHPRNTGVGELTTIGGLGRILRGFRRPLSGFVGNLAVGHVHLFSSTFVHNFRFGYLRNRATTLPFPENVPLMLLDDFTLGFGADFFIPLDFEDNAFNFKETLMITRGAHGIKLGVEYNHDLENSTFDAVSRGLYEFSSLLDFIDDEPYLQFQHIDPMTGQSIIDSPNRRRHFRRRDFAWFIQDDWKVTSNFTLNLGMRYQYFGVIKETNGKQAGIHFGEGSTFAERFANATFGPREEMYKPDRNNFAPSFGFAWDPRGAGQFVVRGGFSINYDRIHSDLLTEPSRFTPPFGAFAVAVPIAGICQAPIPYSVEDVIKFPPTPHPDFAAPLSPRGGLSLCRFSPFFLDPNLRTPYAEDWNLTFQVALARDWVLELSYAGSAGHKLTYADDPNRFNGDLLDGVEDRLNPDLLWVSYMTTDTDSIYHGGTVQIKKRFSHGYLIQASYTFGKVLNYQDDPFAGDFIGAGTGYFGSNDVTNRAAERGRSSFDIRHRFTANFVWEIGAFRSHGPLFRALLGGWQLNGVISYETGRPFTVFNTAFAPVGDYNLDGGGGTQATSYDRPNTPAFGNTVGCLGPHAYIRGLFKPSDFPIPEPGVPGDLGRNTFCGPDFASVDFSLFKNFDVPFFGEAGKVQFRFEAFNLFNRVNLWLPDNDLAGDPLTFGKSTQAYIPRELQFGLKLIW